MPGALRYTLVFALLAGAAAATWFLSRPPQLTAVTTGAQPPAPLGYYLRNAVLLGTDASGAVTYRIFASLVEQSGENEDLVLTEVRVEYAASEEIPWLVTAERAAARNGGEHLELYDGVRLSTQPSDATAAIVIETQSLQFEPETYIARATEPVTVSRGGARLVSGSLSANLKTDQIDLESVHGQFDR